MRCLGYLCSHLDQSDDITIPISDQVFLFTQQIKDEIMTVVCFKFVGKVAALMNWITLAASVILGMLEKRVTPITTTAAFPHVFMVS